MSKRAGWALMIAAIATFLLLNRAAYRGYFQDDDLDTLSWARALPASEFLKSLITLRLSPTNFRPVGAFYYHALEGALGLDFPRYVVVLHGLHLLNIWLVWLIARKLGIGPWGAAAGAFFFGFHAALLDAWWKPMYVFDVLCATFSLLTVLLYAWDRWILSLISFWLAYKSKELAVMLPAVLACYEIWFGQRRWKRLIPFLAVSLLFGIQAALLPHRGTQYEMQLGSGTLATTIRFYSSQLFLLPYAGLLLFALPFFIRDRRLWFGLASMCTLIVPLLLLPGRLYAVYWYLPLVGAALMLASLANGHFRWAAVLLLVLWIPWDFIHLRELRRVNLRLEQQNHVYVAAIEKFAGLNPGQSVFVYDDLPQEFHRWGAQGALRTVYRNTTAIAQHIDQPGSMELIQKGDAAWLHWSPGLSRLDIVRYPRERPLLPYLKMDISSPPNQLHDGWYNPEDNFRWTKPDATAVLLKPEGARRFEVVACIPPEQIRRYHAVALRVLADAQPVGHHEFTAPGCQTVAWPAPPGPAGKVTVEFHSTPPYSPPNDDPRVLGISIAAFGFTSQ